LDHLDVERVSRWSFGLVGQQNLLPAGPVPALVLTENECHDSVPAVLVPLELTAERTKDEISHAEGKTVDVHVRCRPPFLILPDAGFEGRQMRVGLAPVVVQGRGLMSDKPEGANA